MPNNNASPDPSLHQVTSADGTEISFERSGQGETVILVAQALSDLRDNRRLGALLAVTHTVVNYDRRGRGNSGDNGAWSVAREIEDIEALIDAHGGRAVLFGASSGAVLALDAAAALPEKVTGVIAYEPPVIADDRRAPVPRDLADRLEGLIRDGRASDAVREFNRVALGASPLMIAAMRLMVGPWRTMVAMAQTTVYDTRLCTGLQDGVPLATDRWKGLRVHCLVLVGSKSEPFMQSGTRELSSLTGASYATVDGAHHATPMMRPSTLIPSVLSFLNATHP
ncbi:alpha/beta fold hydrolase [Microbacterium maritypicum]|uniref:Alpha/beta hydrolase n=1 Tax=Microbacterium maritypicum TaxID=33918 RepID=A0ACD4B269_MICMQ|nr:alpha/beta fold hydrolase [Microbacterium liquefaciens]UTT51735.1 alpha/beta hydrolase [Microbacterium liquefaciens]